MIGSKGCGKTLVVYFVEDILAVATRDGGKERKL
jgi:hypothetical protein